MSAHFSLGNDSAYHAWRDAKLANYPTSVDQLIVRLDDPPRRRYNLMRG
jgi:hypothetical protein